MNYEDLDNAIQFLDVKDNLVLQCSGSNNIGLIKRYLFHKLGQPRKMIGSSLWYGDKIICIVNVSPLDALVGFKESECFYIRSASGNDRDELIHRGFKPSTSCGVIQVWKGMGMSVITMYNTLRNDGHSHLACKMLLANQGITAWKW